MMKSDFIKENLYNLIKIILTFIILTVSLFVENEHVKLLILSLGETVIGLKIFFNSIKSIFKVNFFDENFLMILASFVAFIIGEYFEGVIILFLFSIGELLEDLATESSKKKIASLSKYKINAINVYKNGKIIALNPNEVNVGSLIVVKSGEIVPIDSVLIKGSAEIDLSSITGESNPIIIEKEKIIMSGAINLGDVITLKTVKEYKDSTQNKINELIESAVNKKSKSQKFISKFSKIYTPLVVVSAIILPIILGIITGDFNKWIYSSLSFLIISCPCALIISVPLSYFIGIGALTKCGIVIKGSNYIDALSNIKTIVFDKTGTLTKGEFYIKNIDNFSSLKENEILNYAYYLEENSNHPLGKAFKNIVPSYLIVYDNIKEIKGKGIIGILNNDKYVLGNMLLLSDNGVKLDNIIKESSVFSVLYFAKNKELIAIFYLTDKIKEESKRIKDVLSKNGVKDFYILSGDNKFCVEYVAKKIGIKNYYYDLLPQEKYETFNKIKSDKLGKTAFVGDGINDSLVLSTADVGISMGKIGSDLAIESSNIVIMGDNLLKIADAIKNSKRINKIVKENVIGSISIKVLIMILSLLIKLPLIISSFADVGVMILAILNSLRIFKIKK